MRRVVFLLLVLAVSTEASLDGSARVDMRTIRSQLAGDWREFDVRVPRDKQLRESFGIQWTLFRRADPTPPANQAWLTDHDNESTQTTGVVLLNTKASPMWLDFRFLDGAGEFVMVGILRFEDGSPRWVLNKGWVRLADYERTRGDVAGRPTSFVDGNQRPIGYRLEPFTSGPEKREP